MRGSLFCVPVIYVRDLLKANRKYVIGKKYDAVKAITARISSENSTTGKGGHTYRLSCCVQIHEIASSRLKKYMRLIRNLTPRL